MKAKKLMLGILSSVFAVSVAGCAGTQAEKNNSSDQSIVVESDQEENADNRKAEDGSADHDKDWDSASDDATNETTNVKASWMVNGSDIYMDIPFRGGQATITFLSGLDQNEDVSLKMTQGDKMLFEGSMNYYEFAEDGLKTHPILRIDDVGIADTNFDRLEDLIILGESDVGKGIFICECETEPDEAYAYYVDDDLSAKVTDTLNGDLTIENAKEVLLGKNPDGQYESYQDAYKTIVDNMAFRDEGIGFDLIYFNDDDIPDLVVGYPGYWVSLYLYDQDGIHCPALCWSYGVMGNAGYEYLEKKAIITNYNSDYAGLIGNSSYLVMNDRYEMNLAYYEKSYYFDDVDGDGEPSEDERVYTEEAEVKSEYYSDMYTNLSQEEIQKKVEEVGKEKTKSLRGELTKREVLELISEKADGEM